MNHGERSESVSVGYLEVPRQHRPHSRRAVRSLTITFSVGMDSSWVGVCWPIRALFARETVEICATMPTALTETAAAATTSNGRRRAKRTTTVHSFPQPPSERSALSFCTVCVAIWWTAAAAVTAEESNAERCYYSEWVGLAELKNITDAEN